MKVKYKKNGEKRFVLTEDEVLSVIDSLDIARMDREAMIQCMELTKEEKDKAELTIKDFKELEDNLRKLLYKKGE